MSVDPLVLEGWERQNTLDEPRLSEVAEMYREIGFEVRISLQKPLRVIALPHALQNPVANRFCWICSIRRYSSVSS